ncbi:UDP-Glycosyltransferase/glycogen phosphorylase [Mycena rosella]|uniref:UDP-Glycosyltransferase/glycogen phosphorylase n=1 Tax=Mycena rosella TaxID=1033263 RepID=A0AAD7DYL7_MYCRO|nr:UDP-Glycosyltransferase/glycogen phosphorylase [Mycena rosella]
MFIQSDGIFVGTCTAYENEALTALNRWVTLTLHKPLYAVGPLLPPAYGSAGASSSEVPHDLEIQTFLDAALAQHGQNSTLLVSFGTLFWPTVPQYLDELVDVLTEKKFPFILCHASPFATISPALRDKINAPGVGMITCWSPQQYILSHPATGWFMTHCGHGGVSEALSNGVPLICWPFEGDQPAAAANLSQTLDAAFHLLEVRTGQGLRPLFGGQVPQGTRTAVGAEFRQIADACRGAEGERKRANARKVTLGFLQAWEEGGTARAAVRAFLER